MKKYIYLTALLLSISVMLTACTTKKDQKVEEIVENENSEVTAITEDGEENLSGNIFDLVNLNKSIKCTFKSETEDGAASGVTYVADGKTKTEFEIKNEEMEMKSYSVSDGDWMYTWTSENNQGTKMNLNEMQDMADENIEEETEEIEYTNQTQDFDYKCTPWSVDNSVFELPENIEFMDLSEMMKGFMELQKNLPAME